AVLEERLVEGADVVDDHRGAGVGQVPDALGEGRLAAGRGGEREPGAGGDVVDDLQHRPALVAAVGGGVRQHVDVVGEVAAGHVVGRAAHGGVAVVAVGEDAHGLPGAVEPEGGAGPGGTGHLVPLGGDAAGLGEQAGGGAGEAEAGQGGGVG